MKEIIAPTAKKVNKTGETFSRSSARRNWIVVLYLCSIGGILTGLFGLFLSGLAFFEFVETAKNLHKLGTWLIVFAFPLLMLAAHAMDKIAELDKSSKIQN